MRERERESKREKERQRERERKKERDGECVRHVYLLHFSPKPLLTVSNLKYSIITLETELLVFVFHSTTFLY